MTAKLGQQQDIFTVTITKRVAILPRTAPTAFTAPHSFAPTSNMRPTSSIENALHITTSELTILTLIMLVMTILLLWVLVLTLSFMVRYMTGNLGETGQKASFRKRCRSGIDEEGLCDVHIKESNGMGHFGEKGAYPEKMDLLVGEGVASAVDGEKIETSAGGGARRRSAEQIGLGHRMDLSLSNP